MSLPDQIQRQLFGLPARLAGRAGTFTEGRSDTSLAGPVVSRALSRSVDVLQPRSIGSNLEVSMSSSRDAFLGQQSVSPAAQSPDLATGEFHADGQSFSVLGKGSADGRSR